MLSQEKTTRVVNISHLLTTSDKKKKKRSPKWLSVNGFIDPNKKLFGGDAFVYLPHRLQTTLHIATNSEKKTKKKNGGMKIWTGIRRCWVGRTPTVRKDISVYGRANRHTDVRTDTGDWKNVHSQLWEHLKRQLPWCPCAVLAVVVMLVAVVLRPNLLHHMLPVMLVSTCEHQERREMWDKR